MHKLAFAAVAASTLVSASSAIAGPLGITAAPPAVSSMVDDVRLVCNEWGRCWRTGPRYGYGYYGGPRRVYGYAPGYYRGGPRFYGGYRRGPSVEFNFGGPRW
ncbi:hypothetical protein PY365_29630 [Roseiarcaceae bacterium H3SJ34-1]|uniref:hypothetical protein n=1 Tax=Terripilifer ovatus TaxID=3032367 RepID=UPI003AB93C90|nr:hypothetical protein [Roseiarcaceae bacterium H3SJ34-1]